MATIREVAKLAGVSTATVSRVLNNDSTYKMTDETRQRVLDAVSTLNYELPVGASKPVTPSLNGAKIGCILKLTRRKFDDPYFMSILSAAEDRLRKKGYELAFMRTSSELEDRAQLQALFQTPVSGIILMDDLDEEIYQYIHKHVPHIVGISTNHKDIDNIGYDRFRIAYEGTKYLIDKGHTRIGFIGSGGVTKNIKNSQRYRGFQTAMHCANLPVNENWVIDCEWDEDLCAQKVDELCATGDYPTALFVSSDLIAMASMNRFYANNIKVPDDVAILSVTDIEVAKYANPPLTTYHIPAEEIGYVAADLLISRINGYDLLPHRVMLPSDLIVRGTV